MASCSSIMIYCLLGAIAIYSEKNHKKLDIVLRYVTIVLVIVKKGTKEF